MSPPELILPSPQVFKFPPGDEDSGGDFCSTEHGSFRALIVSNLEWGGPGATTSQARQAHLLTILIKAH